MARYIRSWNLEEEFEHRCVRYRSNRHQRGKGNPKIDLHKSIVTSDTVKENIYIYVCISELFLGIRENIANSRSIRFNYSFGWLVRMLEPFALQQGRKEGRKKERDSRANINERSELAIKSSR